MNIQNHGPCQGHPHNDNGATTTSPTYSVGSDGLIDFSGAPEPFVYEAREPLESHADLKRRLDLAEVVRRCGVELKPAGRGQLKGCCPLHEEKTPSFHVYQDDQRFKCFGCGQYGDVIDFVAKRERLDGAGAIKRAAELAGGSAPLRPAFDRAKADRAQAREDARKVAKARRWWEEAAPLVATVVEGQEDAHAYLKVRRGIQSWPDDALRWHPACPWGPDGGTVGCILAPLVDPATGQVCGVHRIRPTLEGKVERRAFGRMDGCVVPLFETKGEALGLAEGVEDALAAHVLTGLPVWAAISAGNLPEVALPVHVREVVIFADKDKPQPDMPEGAGIHFAMKAAVRFVAEGRQVRIEVAREGKDANDALLNGKGREVLAEYEPEAPSSAEAGGGAGPEAAGGDDPTSSGLLELEPFPPAEADGAATMAAQEQAIRGAVEAELSRIAFRVAMSAAAKLERERFADGLGKRAKELTKAERRRVAPRVLEAMQAAARDFLEQQGLDRLPARTRVMFTGGQGTGKTRTVIAAVAPAKRCSVAVFVPTLGKAEEVERDLLRAMEEAYRGTPYASPIHVMVWRGRTAPKPVMVEVGGNAGPGRMCRLPERLVSRVQATGVNVRQALCEGCPFRAGCAYIAQGARVQAEYGRLIVIFTHESLFLPLPFTPDLVVVDEDVTLRAASRVTEIDPAALVAAELWEGAKPYRGFTGDPLNPVPAGDIAAALLKALGQRGRELTALREAGVTDPMLAHCQDFLEARYQERLQELVDAGGKGLDSLLDRIEARNLRRVAELLSCIRAELAHPRDRANGVTLDWREKATRTEDGRKAKTRVRRVVVRRVRAITPMFIRRAGLVLLDGTGDAALAGMLFGELTVHRFAAPRQGLLWQVHDVTNSKYRLLDRDETGNNRARMRELVRSAARLAATIPARDGSPGRLFVGCTCKLERTLQAELAGNPECAGIVWMHFGAERGMNTAEDCPVALVIGREELPPWAIEDMARAYAAPSPEAFSSVLDGDSKGCLAPAKRPYRLRGGGTWVDAPVGLPNRSNMRTHPHPLGRAVLEQAREAGGVQMLDRVRAVRGPRIIFLATSVPVDVEVDRHIRQRALEREVAEAARVREDVARQGWALLKGPLVPLLKVAN